MWGDRQLHHKARGWPGGLLGWACWRSRPSRLSLPPVPAPHTEPQAVPVTRLWPHHCMLCVLHREVWAPFLKRLFIRVLQVQLASDVILYQFLGYRIVVRHAQSLHGEPRPHQSATHTHAARLLQHC